MGVATDRAAGQQGDGTYLFNISKGRLHGWNGLPRVVEGGGMAKGERWREPGGKSFARRKSDSWLE